MRSAIGAPKPWRIRAPPRRAVVVVASSAPKAASAELLHLPPGAWAVRRNEHHPPQTVLVVDGTNFAAIAYRSGGKGGGGANGSNGARTEFSRWLAFLSAAVGPTAATVVAFDNKGDEGVMKQQQLQPVVLATPSPRKAARGWDAATAGAFVSGGGGGAAARPPQTTLSGGAHLLNNSNVIPLIAPPGQTADDAIADLCRALRRGGGGGDGTLPPAMAVVVASSDRDMRRLVFSSDDDSRSAVYFLELVAGSKGEASPLRLHCGGADANNDNDANTEAAALALTGSSKHGVAGLDLPGITSRRSAAAMVRASGGGLEGLLRMAAAQAGGAEAAAEAAKAAPALKPAALRALADPETARRARLNYEKVRMGGREGAGGGEHEVVRVAAEEVMGRVAKEAATARARGGDGDADSAAAAAAAAKALFPPFLRNNRGRRRPPPEHPPS
jgi:hypothetical protein